MQPPLHVAIHRLYDAHKSELLARTPLRRLTYGMKVNFKHLMGVLRDLEENQSWKYDELSPVQMLERLKLDKRLVDREELERTEFFWARRPRFLRAIKGETGRSPLCVRFSSFSGGDRFNCEPTNIIQSGRS